MKKVMLFYPPGRFFQRGEDRSQGNVEQSTATSMRAPNDLGYAAATLKAKGFLVFLRDYQTERLGVDDLYADFERFAPDAIFVSVTNTTVFDDIKMVEALKRRNPNLVVMLKGAIFFNPDQPLLDQLNLSHMDYLIGLESEFIVGSLMHAHFFAPENIPSIRGILYKRYARWERTDFASWENDLDSLPFPDRSLINNALYTRPDTGEPQATIVTSRGCPSACIFCMTPTISGAKLRLRSPGNILAELRECYFTYGIRNFFFKSDTFTFSPRWAQSVCRAIIDSDLNGKIAWVANSKVKPIDLETLTLMKQAGCWLVAFGYESGSPETLKRMKKGTTVEDNLRATRLAKQVGLRTFGFFLVGLPWETTEHLKMTRKHIFELDNDFLELHIAIPYHGTSLHELAACEGLIPDTVLGKDYFNAPTLGTKFLSMAEIDKFRRRTLLLFHLRPTYILRKLAQAGSNLKIFASYWQFGMRLLKNSLFSFASRHPADAMAAPHERLRVLILGANSDIGYALAEILADRDQAELILASRDAVGLAAKAQSLVEKYGGKVTTLPFDAVDYAAHEAFYRSLDPKPDGVLLAFGYLGDQPKAQADFHEARRIIDTNFLGAVSILEIVAQDFARRGHGFIVGISSVAGERGRQSNYIYGAAKGALSIYLSGLRNRLHKHGVRVITVLPGFVRTKMTEHLDLPGKLMAEPTEVADDIYTAYKKGKEIIYTKWIWRWIMAIIKAIPEKIFKRLKL